MPPSQAPGGRWEPRRRARSAGGLARTSYYEQPVIHGPHWKWLIITYFFLGGIAGASYVVATIAELTGARGSRDIARAGRFISLAALLPCPILLILDLGRPERFLNMLRVLKLRSPMSLGTWGLTAFGGFCSLSAMGEAGRDGLLGDTAARVARAVPTRLVGLLGMLPAFFVSGYTGVLLAATAVPLWTRSYLLLGPLFVASALSSATACIALGLALTGRASGETLASLGRLGCIAHLAELVLLMGIRANARGRIGKPLDDGRLGHLFRLGVLGLGIFAPLALEGRAILRRVHPLAVEAVLGSTCSLVGGYLLRYVVVMAGRASADDPHATFERTRWQRGTQTPVATADRRLAED